MYFYSLIENCQLRIAAPKFEFGCGFYFCVISALKYIIGYYKYSPQRYELFCFSK